MTDKKSDTEIPSFEEALGELETIVHQLETGKIKLDEAIASYEKGAVLQKICLEKLQQAQLKVEQLSVSKEGTVQKEEFNVD